MTADNENSCKHLYVRVIMECMKCGQQITNVNSVRYKIPNSDDYIYQNYKPYKFDSFTKADKLTD